MSAISPQPEPGRRVRPEALLTSALFAVAGSLLLTGCVMSWLISKNRQFQVDEVEHIHAVYNYETGLVPYRDFHEAHPPLLWALILPAVDADQPEASLQHSRRIVFGVLALHWLALALAAGRLGGPAASWAALALALTHTTFLERGMEVRPDGLASFFVTLALLAELWRRAESGGMRALPSRHAWSALALSLAFATTNKAIVACGVFGLLWLVRAVHRRSLRLVLVPVAAFLVPLALLVGVLWHLGSLGAFLQINVVDAFALVLRDAPHQQLAEGVDTWRFLRSESLRNAWGSLAMVGGWLASLTAWRSGGDPRLRFVSSAAVGLLLSLWINPFSYPYFHVMVLPIFFVLAGWGIGRLATALSERWVCRTWAPVAAWCLIFAIQGVAFASTFERLRDEATDREVLELQMATLAQIERVTDDGDAVFDLVGLYFQPDAYPVFVMTSNGISKYYSGRFPRMIPALRERGLVAALLNYRTATLPPPEGRFLREHLIRIDGNLLVLGTSLQDLPAGRSKTFHVLAEKLFRFDGEGVLRVDGEPFERGMLRRGDHHLERVSGEGGRLVLDVDPGEPSGPPRKLFVGFD